ncbi:endoplasmic reticulum metallopeptidase 1 [Anaeramoeba flamelloides]|uniref:Endoplasmic reticulum metallopeptidase 1 n=1 Tax=Anaeramoeba flamelloides TaxID=1746091 RepID=A0ABQ8YGJ5_9EUKA|nr:endoplasmic reticulum metallopeptidase 1 [Anaeramoeba flamelloides]
MKNYLLSFLVFILFFHVFIPTLFNYWTRSTSFPVENASLSKFSATRVLKFLEASPEGPHPSGTEEHKKLFEYLWKELLSIEYPNSALLKLDLDNSTFIDVESMGDEYFLHMESIHNILAKIENKYTSSNSTPCVLVSAHTDSHWTGPGACDDLVQVATMVELIRNLMNPDGASKLITGKIVFAFLSGEEWHFEGSYSASRHPWTQDCRVVINLECGGSAEWKLTPVSYGPQEGWLTKLLSEFSPTCLFLNSVIPELWYSGLIPGSSDTYIYTSPRHGPNNGLSGFDLAYFKKNWIYHTQLDTYDKIDPRAIQSGGEGTISKLIERASFELVNNYPTRNKEELKKTKFVLYTSLGKNWVLPLQNFTIYFILTVLITIIGALLIKKYLVNQLMTDLVIKFTLQRIFRSFLFGWLTFFYGAIALLAIGLIQMLSSKISYSFYRLSTITGLNLIGVFVTCTILFSFWLHSQLDMKKYFKRNFQFFVSSENKKEKNNHGNDNEKKQHGQFNDLDDLCWG